MTPLFHYHLPGPPLCGRALFWHWRGHAVARSTERVLPMGTMELVIRLGHGDGCGAGGISGPHSAAFLIERSAEDELLGVHFEPGAAFAFLGCSAGELHNAHVTLDELWGAAPARELAGRLQAAASVQARFALLERWLLRIAQRPVAPHPVVAFALAQFARDAAPPATGRVAREAGLGPKRFGQVFRERVGMAPKLYSRIQRLQRVLHSVAAADDVDWAAVALACGYFDQSHFIHDFREFTGLRPSDYLGLRIAGQANHVRNAG